jgi:hypothetical protein
MRGSSSKPKRFRPKITGRTVDFFPNWDIIVKGDLTMEESKKPLNIEISPEQSEGIYANGIGIRYTPSEFIMDFLRFLPGAQNAKVFSRIIMTPQNVLLLRKALEDNISKYEERFGKIRIFGKEEKEIGFKKDN